MLNLVHNKLDVHNQKCGFLTGHCRPKATKSRVYAQLSPQN